MTSTTLTHSALKEFQNFLFLAWKSLGLPKPTAVQYEIADYLQHGPKRRIICAFRGVGKSYIAVAYIIWRLLLDPDLKALVVSASKQRADDFSNFCFQLMVAMGPLTAHLLPKDDQRNSRVAFDVAPAKASGSPSVTSRGIFSQITGSRADIILADDVSASSNSATATMREKVSEAVKEFEAVLKPDDPKAGRRSDIIYLGTYQSEDDLLLELPNRGYGTRVWPARIPSQEQEQLYGDRLAPGIVKRIEAGWRRGVPTDPLRFDEDDLLQREMSYGATGFSMQFMLLPNLSDEERYPLKLRNLIVTDLSPDGAFEKYLWTSSPDNAWGERIPNVGFNRDRFFRPMATAGEVQPYQGIVMAIDPSGRGKDETGYAVVAYLNSQLFVLAAGGLAGGFEENVVEDLAKLAAQYRVNSIIVESNFGLGMFEALLKPKLIDAGHTAAVEQVRHSIQKERRIADTLEPIVSQHRLIIDPQVIIEDYNSTRNYPPDERVHRCLMHQMSRLTRDKGALKFDDRLDALSMACAFWAENMALHRDQEVAAAKNARYQKKLEEFLEHCVGADFKKKASGWVPRRPGGIS